MSNTIKLGIIGLLLGATVSGIGLYFYNSSQSVDTDSAEVSMSTGAAGKLNSEYLASYVIDDTGFGTKVEVVIDTDAGTRNITRNALPNHETGEFPNEGNPNTITEQDLDETYPLIPVFTGEPSFARTVGIAINGVKLEPDTAERVTCDTGEVYSIEAIQNLTNLGLDFNNAHVQPTGEYHYHGASDLLIDIYDTEQDLVHVAFAADGHNIYYSKSAAYNPSYTIGENEREGTNCTYTEPGPSGGEKITVGDAKDGSLKSDWDFSESSGDLDECNGIEINSEYIYLMTDTYPYISRCLMGVASEDAGNSGAPTGGDNQPQGPPPINGQGMPPARQ